MWTILIIIGVIFLIGLIFRNKGDGFLDTLSSGCGAIIGLIILGVILIVIFLLSN